MNGAARSGAPRRWAPWASALAACGLVIGCDGGKGAGDAMSSTAVGSPSSHRAEGALDGAASGTAATGAPATSAASTGASGGPVASARYAPRCASRAECERLAKGPRDAVAGACAEACAASGRCGRDGERCVARSVADCRDALVCLLDGLCSFLTGTCETGEGTCPQCRVGDAADCQGSLGCHELGRCTLTPPVPGEPWAACTVGGDADCRAAASCRVHGECTAFHGACVATSPADCERSAGCQREGRCRHTGDSCTRP